MKTLNERQWELLDMFLVNVSELDYPTWEEKKKVLKENLSYGGWNALVEISAWMEGE